MENLLDLNSTLKIKKELERTKKELAECQSQQALLHQKSGMTKAVNDLMKLQTFELLSCIKTMQQSLDVLEKNVRVLQNKLIEYDMEDIPGNKK